jgi:flavin-dependent dehydrogenase
MGLAATISRFHRTDGVRVVGWGRSREVPWPEHPDFPSYGHVVSRRRLDAVLAEHAAARGAVVRDGTEVVAPVLRNGLLVGATLRRIADDTTEVVRARYVVVADGTASRLGAALGARRDRSFPYLAAAMATYESPLHEDRWLESSLDLRDHNGDPVGGVGWVFPTGDGTVGVGIGVLTTAANAVDSSRLLATFATDLPEYWGIEPARPVIAPAAGRIPLAGAVQPRIGPNWLVAGDAVAAVDPFNADGIDAALATGRLAATHVAEAVASRNGLDIARYADELASWERSRFKLGRLAGGALSQPGLLSTVVRGALGSRRVAAAGVRLMSGLGRDGVRPTEAVERLATALARAVPETGGPRRS